MDDSRLLSRHWRVGDHSCIKAGGVRSLHTLDESHRTIEESKVFLCLPEEESDGEYSLSEEGEEEQASTETDSVKEEHSSE